MSLSWVSVETGQDQFANAALFHVPSQELPRVLGELRACLKPGGVLFSSNPRGNDEEGWNRGRYGAYYRIETWRGFLAEAGFVELAHYYRPTGLPREQQAWLASVWRRARGNPRSGGKVEKNQGRNEGE